MNEEQLMERISTLYERNFSNCNEGRAFLESRGITNTGLYTRHHIGYCNGSLNSTLPSSGNVLEELTQLGILTNKPSVDSTRSTQTRFPKEHLLGCLTFPLFDVDGKITNILGLHLKTLEHLSLPERHASVWNIRIIKTCNEVYVLKTILDALSLEMAYFPNVVTVFKTDLGDEEKQLFSDYDVRTLPGHDGANECLLKEGPMKLAERVAKIEPTKKTAAKISDGNSPKPLSHGQGFGVTYGRRRYEIRGLEKKTKSLRVTLRVEHAGKLYIDTQDLYSSKGRKTISMELCRIFNETPETIEADLTRLIKQCEEYEPAGNEKNIPAMSAWEKEEAEEFGKSPNLIKQIHADFQTCGLVAEEANRLLSYLAMTSRKTDEPLCIMILSSSGAGKTFLQDVALSLCPPEDMIKVTSLSGKALFYRDPGSLKHKVLAIEEEAGAEQADYALRSLITSKQLSVEAVVKDLSTGRLVTMRNVVQGRTAVFLTTTNPYVNPETRSRFIVLSVDESREQTRRILEYQRTRQMVQCLAQENGIENIQRKHRNFQRLLSPVKVVNPYAGQLGYGDDRLQSRRDQPKYLNLIKAVAFLRQMQKEKKVQKDIGTLPCKGFSGHAKTQYSGSVLEYITVDREDIRIANQLAHDTMGHSLNELSSPSQDLLNLLEEMMNARNGDIRFSRRDIREQIGWTNTRLHIHLKELLDFEFLTVESGHNGTLQRYRLAYEGQGKDGSKFLIGLKSVDQLQEPEK